ncbi:MAG: amidophosphoribosyltransferase [Candidatus Bathyarchaeia archaeon]
MSDIPDEACGVFGVYSYGQISVFPYLYFGLISQNHRGHQSYGFLTFDGRFYEHKALGLVPIIKEKKLKKWLKKLPGHVGIGNVRYATSGGTNEWFLRKDMQPVISESGEAKIGISYNGNIVNARQLVKEITKKIGDVSSSSDTELICKKLLIEIMNGNDLTSSVRTCMEEMEGAFSVVGLTGNGELFAFKDPHGIKPLCCGHDKKNNTYAISSETVGLDINNFEYDFEINPGELVTISENGLTREQIVKHVKKALCSFEFAYFARPDSNLGNGKYVYEVRRDFGRNLGKEYSEIIRNLDLVVPIPETAIDAAYGLHEETGVMLEYALRRHRYVTERAFILLPGERYATIDKKINIVKDKISGKKIAVVEDSIVRGDTSRVIVKKLYEAGAKEVHVFVTYPRIIAPCFYGIDMATFRELIGYKREPEEVAKKIGAKSVNYQSLDGFVKCTGLNKNELCLGCITCEYPTPLAQEMADEARSKLEKGCVEKGRIYEGKNG